MRPGEKFHEDMLCKTELPFTFQPSDKLLTVLPQYTNREHTYDKRYEGVEFNSSLHNNDNVVRDSLEDIVKFSPLIEITLGLPPTANKIYFAFKTVPSFKITEELLFNLACCL